MTTAATTFATTIPPRTARVIFQNEPGSHTITLGEQSELLYILSFKNKNPDDESVIELRLDGADAHAEIIGLFAGGGNDTVRFKTRALHRADRTYAHTTIKTMLRDDARSDYTGLIRIEPHTRETDGHLAHDTILLSSTAKSRSIPSLEIEAHDVKAGHSASIGQIDEEVLFYLKSRGLTEEQAREIIIEGFFESALGKIPDKDIAEQIRTSLAVTATAAPMRAASTA